MAPSPLAEQIDKLRSKKGLPATKTPAAPQAPRGGRGGRGNQVKARKRLARIRLADPKALPGVKPTARGNLKRADRYAILDATRDLNKRRKAAQAKKEEDNYNPLAPLFGKDMKRELDAAERLEFGESERVLGEAFKAQSRQQDVVGSAYDQYRQALADATTRVNAANANAATATQSRVDSSYEQDKAAQAERDKAAAAKMSTFGLTAEPQSEGARAIEAQRSQGNLKAGDIRQQGASDTSFYEGRGATAVQAKAEALSREGRKREELEGKQRELASQKGSFRTSHRGKLRSGEREWAAIQKEFDLKVRDQDLEAKADKASNAANVLVAKLYADANKAKARATIRVAKLQLEKGKIDQKQYREIVNIYKGLPEKGESPKPKPKSGGGKPKLQTWERDKIDKAIGSLTKAKATVDQKGKYMQKMIDGGLPPRLARIAWEQYRKPLTTPYDDRVRG